ncbi:MAG: response regulator, partial [Chloroflexota bacterium]
ELRGLRMVPASSVLDLFPRMLRDIAREQGKEVEWSAQGAGLEMDRQVLEAMKDPLIHLVRNAISHGIEPPEARESAGKPRRGRVEVSIAALEGNRVEIAVRDDGAGLDLAEVQAAAVRARLVSAEEARVLTEAATVDLVFRSGLSTSPIITDLAGHGLGLAIIEERVEQLGGRIRIETRAGAGATMRMVIPASIASFHGLLVQAGGQRFLLPLDSVQRAILVAAEAVERLEAGHAIRWNEQALPVSRLAALLGLPEDGQRQPGTPGAFEPCVVLSAGEEQIGLLVAAVLGEREVLAKELNPPLARVPNVAGAGVLGNGQLVLILRPADLARSLRARSVRGPVPTGPRSPQQALAILVVDDSITTRTMEKNLLETAGYRVRVAVDGLEAWTLLKSEDFDLVVSDVDMPRLDGFGLTERIRADRQLADLPVVLVTALESREDKERGIEAGANAYVVKSSFDQSTLLAIIGRLA